MLSCVEYIDQWTYPGLAPFGVKIVHSCVGIWFFSTTQVHTPNGILIGSAIYAGLVVITYRQTTLFRL